MSVATNKIKSRIKSVTGAYKVTSAMKLVSSVKLQKIRRRMFSNTAYSDKVEETLLTLLKYNTNIHSPYVKKNETAHKKLFIILSSTLGLCGAYNTNIFKVVDQQLSPEDDAIILGKKALSKYSNGQFVILDEFVGLENESQTKIVSALTDFVLKEYAKEVYSEVILIHSEYKNSLLFLAKASQLLPLNEVEKEENSYAPLFEPSAKELIERIIPFYLTTLIFAKVIESNVCEQASRSNAMENATNNAKELLDNLNLEFNKARQASITQEIIEIVSASKAL